LASATLSPPRAICNPEYSSIHLNHLVCQPQQLRTLLSPTLLQGSIPLYILFTSSHSLTHSHSLTLSLHSLSHSLSPSLSLALTHSSPCPLCCVGLMYTSTQH